MRLPTGGRAGGEPAPRSAAAGAAHAGGESGAARSDLDHRARRDPVGAGEAIAIGHYASTDASNRAFDFVPVIGPAVVGFHDRSSDWTSPLVFASWLEAAGVIIAASAGYALVDTRVHVGASVSPEMPRSSWERDFRVSGRY